MLKYRVGLLTVIMLVLLRISLGWHFLYQGIDKFKKPDFSSETYLRQSKGPMAPFFRGMVPDVDGQDTLQAAVNAIEVKGQEDVETKESLKTQWEQHFQRFKQHYQFSDNPDNEQNQAAQKVFETHWQRMEDYLRADTPGRNAPKRWELMEIHLLDLQTLARDEASTTSWMPAQQKHLWDRRESLYEKAVKWVDEINEREQQFHQALMQTLTEEQKEKFGELPPQWTQMDYMNVMVKYTNIAIGICLIAGFLTPLAALGGAAFLLLIVLSQPALPNIYPPPHPSAGAALVVNKEFIEMMALLVIAALPYGRWAGIDSLIVLIFGGFQDPEVASQAQTQGES